MDKLTLLSDSFWPGPLTLILPKKKSIPDIATSGLSTVAVRFPSHQPALKLIALSGTPLAAPSANTFGCLSPTCAEHVLNQLGTKIDIILDGGRTLIGVESTVLEISGEYPRILRPGGIPKEKIEALIGAVNTGTAGIETPKPETPKPETAMLSPGMLKSHYAPQIPLQIFSADTMLPEIDEKQAFLFFDANTRDTWLAGKNIDRITVKTLSESGDLQEAAANFFQFLHDLDNSGFSRIIAQLAPEYGLGAAINDRLKRAAMH
jgi:L-threonylcarbamoyladenylate synthase